MRNVFKTHRRLALSGLAVAIVLPLTAASCDKVNEPYRDAPRGAMNDQPADTMTFPDGFSNVASKCDGTNRIYVVFHGDAAYGAVAVVPNDARCSK